MSRKIIVAGSGFAGTWAALSAARAVSQSGYGHDIEIIVVSPAPEMHIRPRLYEPVLKDMAPDISDLLACVEVKHVAGKVETITTAANEIVVRLNGGSAETHRYDRFVLAAGSTLFRPPIPGLEAHAFNVDQLADAKALDRHLHALKVRPDTPARATVVVVGGGFTGIETVTELRGRLRDILGPDTPIDVILVEQAPEIGPDLGPGPRPQILEALAEAGVSVITSAGAVEIGPDFLRLSNGRTIKTETVVWTAGARANPLAAQINGEHDRFGRVVADRYLHAPDAPGVFVTGDVARALTDHDGHVAAMSCQHALSLGRVAGHNAAAEILGLPLHAYSQPKYVTCLDLGPWGAVFTEGWNREVKLTRAEGKSTKKEINTKWIYPPAADRDAVFAIANPDYVIVP